MAMASLTATFLPRTWCLVCTLYYSGTRYVPAGGCLSPCAMPHLWHACLLLLCLLCQGARVWTLRVLSDTKPVLVDGLPLTKEAGPVALRPLAMITIGPVVLNLLLPRAFADHVRNMQRYKRGKNAIAPFLGAFPSTQHLHEALAYLNTSRETSKDTCETRWAQLTKAVAATVRGWRSHVSEEDVIEDDDDFEPSTARENTPAAEEEGDEPMDAPPKRLAAPSKPLYVRKSQASPMDVW